MGSISKNFSYSEFERSEIAQRKGYINVISTAAVRDSIQALVRNVLQPLRTAWGRPLTVNSGYRCPELNADPEVGGVPTSQHLKGEAADIRCSDPLALARLAVQLKLPFDQMILYPTFVHFSHKLHGEQRGEILYNRSWKGEKLDDK